MIVLRNTTYKLLRLPPLFIFLAMLSCGGGGGGSSPPPGQLSLVLDQAAILNGSFDTSPKIGANRPPNWYIGLKEDAPLATGAWSLDTAEFYHGSQSLRLDPAGTFFVSQLLHVPGTGLAGETISFSVRVKHQGLSSPPVVMMFGLNPNISAIDPIFGDPGFSASTAVMAPAAEGVWHEVTGNIVSLTEMTAAGIFLVATSASGTAWFDQVEIDSPQWNPALVIPETPTLPISTRNFDMGFTSAAPMDPSDQGFDNLIEVTRNSGTMMNFFFPIQWCRLAANPIPCESDPKHAHKIALVQDAKDAGLKIGLTFNFTHATADAVGDLNPLPDDTSPGTMLDADVRDALKAELLWLFDQIDPDYVATGIEMDLMLGKHPTWWAPYVTLHGEIYDAIKAIDTSTHVTTYHTHAWSVNNNGSLNAANANTWRMLLPKLDSIAFSSYPTGQFPGQDPSSYPPGYFSRPSDIAPGLPIMLNEFGVGGGGSSGLTNTQQAELLKRMIQEFASVNPVAIVMFQAYDLNYLGQPMWFKDIFSPVGIAQMDGKIKPAYFVWKELFKLGP